MLNKIFGSYMLFLLPMQYKITLLLVRGIPGVMLVVLKLAGMHTDIRKWEASCMRYMWFKNRAGVCSEHLASRWK